MWYAHALYLSVALLCHRDEMELLSLKCQSTTQLHVLFGEPWLVQINHVRLTGAVPYDRWAAGVCQRLAHGTLG